MLAIFELTTRLHVRQLILTQCEGEAKNGHSCPVCGKIFYGHGMVVTDKEGVDTDDEFGTVLSIACIEDSKDAAS